MDLTFYITFYLFQEFSRYKPIIFTYDKITTVLRLSRPFLPMTKSQLYLDYFQNSYSKMKRSIRLYIYTCTKWNSLILNLFKYDLFQKLFDTHFVSCGQVLLVSGPKMLATSYHYINRNLSKVCPPHFWREFVVQGNYLLIICLALRTISMLNPPLLRTVVFEHEALLLLTDYRQH